MTVGRNVCMTSMSLDWLGQWPITAPLPTSRTWIRRANTWASGRNTRWRDSGRAQAWAISAPTFAEMNTKQPWVSSTPLGRPVVPDV